MSRPDTFVQGRVGIVDVGAMGRPILNRLKARGFDVSAYVRRDEVKAELDAMGVTLEPDVKALGKGRDFIISYVLTDAQTRQVALDDGLIDSMDPGSILIIHTTGSMKTVQEIGERGAARGVKVVDAGGAWPPPYTALGEMTLMVGGEPEDVARCMPVMETYAYPIHHMGPLGSGMALKLINNAVAAVHFQLASEVMRISRDLGLDAFRVLRCLTYATGGSTAMHLMCGATTEERFWESSGYFLYKDLTVVYEAAEQVGLDLGMIGELNKRLMKHISTTRSDRPATT